MVYGMGIHTLRLLRVNLFQDFERMSGIWIPLGFFLREETEKEGG
jgi:hypothetical protein